jgi:hypothetical protein
MIALFSKLPSARIKVHFIPYLKEIISKFGIILMNGEELTITTLMNNQFA